MASAWIVSRPVKDRKSYLVRFRTGGGESKQQHGGAFRTMKEARARRDWIAGELAAMRTPDLRLVVPQPVETLRVIAERWRTSRVDVSAGTALTHRTNLDRILKVLGDRPIESLRVADVTDVIATLDESGLARESIRKTIATFAMVLDFAKVVPNPVRDRDVKLPPDDRAEVAPPTIEHVLAVCRLLPKVYRLPMLTLDATGMRVGELEALTWGDVDEPAQRWRVSQTVAKTRRARYVPVDPAIFAAAIAQVPREDRDLAGQVFAGFGASRFRTAITRACKASAVPAFSPHDLRHRRATLWHLSGVPVAEASSWLGHSSAEHLRTYAHATLADRREIDFKSELWTLELAENRVTPVR